MRQVREDAERGDKFAQYRLGHAFQTGSGVLQDYELAAVWLRKSATQGVAEAQFSLAILYRDGLGMPRDLVEAHKWLNLAAARLTGAAQTQAAGLRDQVTAQLTPAEVTEAQRRAREWMAAFEDRRP
jgi:TPR repeat protein